MYYEGVSVVSFCEGSQSSQSLPYVNILYLTGVDISQQLMWHDNKKLLAKRSKGLAMRRGGVGLEQKRADLVGEWDAIGHLVDVLLRVEVIPLVKAPAQLWVVNQRVSL